MKEGVFLSKNREKWEKYEQLTRHADHISPDKLAHIFIDLTDDLAYSRTHHPNSPNTRFLNDLTARVHQTIYHKNKKYHKGVFKKFWTTDLPLTMYQARWALLYSFLIFSISTLIGVVSALQDEGFARIILGDEYVDMTLDNIESGNPTGVYQREAELPMFVLIGFNNLKVALNTFVWGGGAEMVAGILPLFIFLTAGTMYILFVNGVMLGTFQTLFYEHNLLWESASVIWLHGTIEICSIILAGCAGIVMGNSILFPGTYKRIDSFRRGARQGAIIMTAIIPYIILAAFIEGYVTRYADMPMFLKLTIIIGSFALMIGYFVLYPLSLGRRVERRNSEIVTNNTK